MLFLLTEPTEVKLFTGSTTTNLRSLSQICTVGRPKANKDACQLSVLERLFERLHNRRMAFEIRIILYVNGGLARRLG